MLRPQRLVRPFLAFLVLGCTALGGAAVRAGDKWPVPVGPSHEPDPFHYDAKVWKDVPRDYLDDAAACILHASTSYLVEPDGTVETVVHDVTRLNGRKGIEKLGEYRNLSYDPSYETLTLNTAVIHKADGHDAPIEPRDVQLRDVSTDYQVYDHEKQLIISFPHLEVGDVFEVKWTVRGKNPEHAGQFFTRYTFGDATYPCVTDELRVRLPKSMPLKYASFVGSIEPIRTEDKDTVLYTWKSELNRQLPQDENLPSKETLFKGVACSTFPSWEAIGQWKQKLREDCWVCTGDVHQTAYDVTKGLKDPIAKARALVYWMRRNIRYVSTGEMHDYTPHKPSEILANRYGDCKDGTQLLAVMMREVGIKVELATLGAEDDGQVLKAVPSPWGSHAILVATIDGKEHWVDTTSSLAGWDFLPHDDRDRLCYVVDDKGAIRLTRTPPPAPRDNRMEQVTNVWVGPDGSTRCERDVTSYGTASLVERDAYLEVPVGERRRQVTAELQDANSRARLVRLDIDEESLRDFDRPVKAHVDFIVGDQFSGDPDKEGSVADSKVWGKFVAYNLDYDRKTPLEFYSTFETHHTYIVHIPALFALDGTPSDQTLTSPWGEFTRKAALSEDGRTLTVAFTMRLDKARVEPADFDQFRAFHESVSRYYRAWLTLKPAQEMADAKALEGLLAAAPDDADVAAALARIEHRNDKDADARRVLHVGLFYHPGDEALLKLNVKAAATAKDETAAQRELVRRYPGNDLYGVELGALLVDQNQHDAARKVPGAADAARQRLAPRPGVLSPGPRRVPHRPRRRRRQTSRRGDQVRSRYSQYGARQRPARPGVRGSEAAGRRGAVVSAGADGGQGSGAAAGGAGAAVAGGRQDGRGRDVPAPLRHRGRRRLRRPADGGRLRAAAAALGRRLRAGVEGARPEVPREGAAHPRPGRAAPRRLRRGGGSPDQGRPRRRGADRPDPGRPGAGDAARGGLPGRKGRQAR